MRLIQLFSVVAAATLGGTLFSCRGKTVATAATERASRTVTVNGRQRQMPRGDELYWRVGARAPGFGGFYLDEAGNPTIVLLDLRDSAAARVAVSQLLGGCSSAHACHYVEGQFTYVELATWRDSLIHELFARGLATSMGMDQRANRVSVGATRMTDSAIIAARITALGIPLKAVAIRPGLRARAR